MSHSRSLWVCEKRPQYGKDQLFMGSSHTSTKSYQIKLVGITLSKSKCYEALLETQGFFDIALRNKYLS